MGAEKRQNSNEVLIDPNDFESIELDVTLTNQTTQTQIRNGKKGFGKKFAKWETSSENYVTISEFIPDGIVFDSPHRTCATGHFVQLDIKVLNTGDNFELSVAGKVTDTQKVSDTRESISLTLQEFEKVEWDRFMDLFGERQTQILDFFQAVKG